MKLRFLLQVLWVAGWLLASSADAQDDAYARAIEQAVTAYNEGDFAAARAHFAEAHALHPSARTLRGLGIADFELARWPDSVEELSAALKDTRSPLSGELRTSTEEQLTHARAQLAGPPDELPQVEEPGPVPSRQALDDRRAERLRSGAIVSLSLGVAGLALATGYGVRSIHEGHTRDRYCDRDGVCANMRGVNAGDDARLFGNIATAGWILGSVGLAGAAALFWVDHTRHADRPRAQLRIGPTSIAIVGTL